MKTTTLLVVVLAAVILFSGSGAGQNKPGQGSAGNAGANGSDATGKKPSSPGTSPSWLPGAINGLTSVITHGIDAIANGTGGNPAVPEGSGGDSGGGGYQLSLPDFGSSVDTSS